ncbi:MAG: phosphate acyltransferase PlsX [Promethearchaeota archaeon]
MTIILDAMGSDDYPFPEILGAIEAQKLISEEIILVGDKKLIEQKMKELSVDKDSFSIVDAPEFVKMWEKPVESAKKKPNNSMAVGIRLVKDENGSSFVTAGNTGGAMFNGLRVLGRMKGVQRPALSAIFPTRKGKCIVLDIGANADCRPEFLHQFAIMGSIYSKIINNVDNPRVGLISNGEEAGKGNQLVKDTYKLLEKSTVNFIGNVEPKELFAGEADVVVTDGFTGNVFVKGSEAIAKYIIDVLKESLMSSFRTKIGALLAKPAFNNIKSLIDPGDIGAAPLLGLDGLVLVGHGRSDARAITSSLILAHNATKSNLIDKMREGISSKL